MAKKPGALPAGSKPAINQKKLRSLLASARSARADISEIAGGMGEAISKAVENDHLDRKAFNIVKSLDKMEPDRLADVLENLEHYLDISGLNERAASAPRLPIGEEGDGDHNEAEADEREQDRATAAKNGAANGAGKHAEPAKKPGTAPAGSPDGNVSNFPTPQGRA